ncbi:MAG: hypothetical protein FWF18_00415 [Dehalococcoidia bacterium]|nr:hypothetical protein [Dehalococcoidia bacterium]
MESITLKARHVIIIAAVLIAAIGVGAYFIFFHNPADISDNNPSVGGIVFKLDESAKEYTGREPENKGGTSGIKIPGYDTVRLPSGTTDVKMILLNPEGNPCYFVFELVINGERYYKSDFVEPSMCIEDLKLTKPLPKGTHTAILKISTYSLDESLSQMNGANVEFELIVV